MGLFSSSKDKRQTHPLPPPPAPPLPPPPSSSSFSAETSQSATILRHPVIPGSIGIGIEIECLLQPHLPEYDAPSLKLLGRKIAEAYNRNVDNSHPRMHSTIGHAHFGQPFQEWSLSDDPTIEAGDNAPWGVEIISPILQASPASRWRQHVQEMWRTIEKEYQIIPHDSCGTHVHISIAEGYTTGAVKRIAQAVIYFEPAFEALLPPNRRRNEYTMSNWIDNPNFGHKNKTRLESIGTIESCSTTRQVVELMCPQQIKYWGFNFLNIINDPHSTIEFRRGTPCASINGPLVWAELAMSFIQAAIKYGTPANFRKIPSSVEGLQWFLQNGGLDETPGMNDTRYLAMLFENTNPKASLEPTPIGKLSTEKRAKLKRKKYEDEQKNVTLAKLMKPPYWVT